CFPISLNSTSSASAAAHHGSAKESKSCASGGSVTGGVPVGTHSLSASIIVPTASGKRNGFILALTSGSARQWRGGNDVNCNDGSNCQRLPLLSKSRRAENSVVLDRAGPRHLHLHLPTEPSWAASLASFGLRSGVI